MLIFSSGYAKKAEFPKRPLELVIPFGVGGASDISARQFAKIAEKYIRKPINCVNKGGSGTVEGFEYAYAQKADGYTLLELTTSVLMKEAQNACSAKFTATFDPLVMMMADFSILCVKKGNHKFQTLDQMRAYAKAKPGALKISGISAGAFDDCVQSQIAKGFKIKWTFVPYKSGSEAKAAILGGETDLIQDKVASILPLLESGDLIPLLLASNKRVKGIPILEKVPCADDFGIKGIPVAWRSIAVRKGTPKAIRSFLLKALRSAFNDKAFMEYKRKNYLNLLAVDESPAAMRKTWKKELETYDQFYKEIGIIK
ncbi:MAG: tripartite tricarboxylate transporter substrate binding protein [Bacillota bacterium]|jgi:tripartite-type tricarboxylate transporter receptor subunit TctC